MRLRLQKLDAVNWGWAKVRVAMQPSPGEEWISRTEVRQYELGKYERQAGIKDLRDSSELHSQAKAARRESGHRAGFAERTPEEGVRRFRGELLAELPETDVP